MHRAPLEGLRVLILEDEFLIAMDVEQLCRDHGAADVSILRHLDELKAATFDADAFHVAIVDVMLAGQSTIGFAGELAERGIPFVFATGYSGSDTLFDAFPGVAIVGKPYVGSTLIDAVIAAVNRRHELSGGV